MKKAYDLNMLTVKRRGMLPELKVEENASNKVRITISLDQEVVDHFKAEANNPGALPYQTQINQVLRKLIGQGHDGAKDLKSELLNDDVFIRKLAKKVGQAHAGK